MPSPDFNALLAEMTPEEIRLLPRLVDTWVGYGWMDVDEATEWLRRGRAWAEFHGITLDPRN